MSSPEIRTRTASINGVDLHLLEAGEPGRPLVILSHGFPELAYSWRHQLPALAEAGFHVIAPDQRGYNRSSAPRDVAAYGIRELAGDLVALIDDAGQEQAHVVGHDWGALIAWDMARLHPERVASVMAVSVPLVQWVARPTDLMRMVYGDRFFYILYFQQVGPAERELDADPRGAMARFLWSASGPAYGSRDQTAELPPMQGTGVLTIMGEPPALPYESVEGPWLTPEDLDVYADQFAASGFFGPVSYYRNLDANFEVMKDLPVERIAMPSAFVGGSLDPVAVMDPSGIERMQNLLPDFRGATVIDGAGHWTQQERPDEFNRALLAFLGSVTG
jgi:pimeloyl-ACP methyl ester carboxylesterase